MVSNTFVLPRGVSTIPQSRIDYNTMAVSLLTCFASPFPPGLIDLEGTTGMQTGMLWYKAGSNTQDGQGQVQIFNGSNFTHNGIATYRVDNYANANIAIGNGKVTYGQLVVLGDDVNNRLYMVNRSNNALVDIGIPPVGYTVSNADLLDGLDSTQFLRRDVASNLAGELTSLPTVRLSNATANSKTIGATQLSGATGAMLIGAGGFKRIAWREDPISNSLVMRSGSYYNAGEKYANTGDGAATVAFTSDAADGRVDIKAAVIGATDGLVTYGTVLSVTPTAVTINANTVWHAGNDGAGSTLDADTVDSLQATQFLRSDVSDEYTSGVLTMYDAATLALGTDGDLRIFHNGANTFIRQTAVSTGTFFIQNLLANSDIYITSNTAAGVTKNMARFSGNTAAVSLYFNDAVKFATTANGIGVTGSVGVTQNVYVTQNVFASYVVGNGFGLTTLNANALTGSVPGTVGLVAGATTTGFIKYVGTGVNPGSFDGGTTDPTSNLRLNYNGYLYATEFFGDGSGLTSLDATQLTGVVSNTRGVFAGSGSGSVVQYTGTVSLSGAFNGGTTAPTATTRLNYNGNLYANKFFGDGTNLSNVNANTLDGLDSAQFMRSDTSSIKSGGTTTYNDGVFLYLGTDNDVVFAHTAINSTLIAKQATSNGTLQIANQANGQLVTITAANAGGVMQNSARFGGNIPSATLYYNDVEKVQTSALGLDISGDINVVTVRTNSVTSNSYYESGNRVYGVRAWGTFDTAANALAVSGGLASVVKGPTSTAVVVFSNPMPDNLYSIQLTSGHAGTPLNYDNSMMILTPYNITANGFSIALGDNNNDGSHIYDDFIYITVMR